MNDEKQINGVEYMQEIIKIWRSSNKEHIFAEYFVKNQMGVEKLKSIGTINDIDSKFKNEFFENIYADKNGTIYDIRFFETTPPQSVSDDLTEYWSALHLHFKKPVKPLFVVLGDK